MQKHSFIPLRCQRCVDAEDGCCSCSCYISHMNLEATTAGACPASTDFRSSPRWKYPKKLFVINGGQKKEGGSRQYGHNLDFPLLNLMQRFYLFFLIQTAEVSANFEFESLISLLYTIQKYILYFLHLINI